MLYKAVQRSLYYKCLSRPLRTMQSKAIDAALLCGVFACMAADVKSLGCTGNSGTYAFLAL